MARKLVVKRLRASDLSFFQPYLLRHPQAKQKSFNLDRAVIEDKFFPSLGEIAEAKPRNQVPVQLTFFGPSGAAAQVLMRKILKQEKNWRLNGEVVHDPDGESGRYDLLAPEDLALMEFTGSGEPEAVNVVLLSATHPADAALHSAITAKFSGSMWVPSADELEQFVDIANPADSHPVRDWLDDALIEDVGLGGGQSARRLAKRRAGRGMSIADLRSAKAAAEVTGRRGEELLNHHLTNSPWPDVASHRWVANENAVAPFDFELRMRSGSRRLVDAKSTSSNFDNPLHMSYGEIDEAVNGGIPYDIARLYEVRVGWAKYRIARDIGAKLRQVLHALSHFPDGVSLDSLSFDPDYFTFDEQEFVVEITDDST